MWLIRTTNIANTRKTNNKYMEKNEQVIFIASFFLEPKSSFWFKLSCMKNQEEQSSAFDKEDVRKQ